MIEYLKRKKELVSVALLAVSAILAFVILIKVTGFFIAPAKARSAVREAVDQSKPNSTNLAAQLGKSKKVADALKKSNLFSPPTPKQHPIKAVMGILGDEALINGKWYKAGKKVGEANILAVNPTSVEIEWDGKKKTFYPLDGAGGSSPGGPSKPGRPTARSSSGGRPGMVVTQGQRPGSGPGGRGMSGGPGGRFQDMSEADRARMRERFENMSEGERDRFRQQMRERMGGSRGGDRGGRGGGPGGGRGGR